MKDLRCLISFTIIISKIKYNYVGSLVYEYDPRSCILAMQPANVVEVFDQLTEHAFHLLLLTA